MRRRIVWTAAFVVALGVAARYLDLDFLRAPIERSLERGLGRKVEVGSVHLNLFGAPGFTLESVVIHDDPRSGIEPFAYVDSLNGGLRWLSLLHHRVDFSSLSLGDATINVVKNAEGAWNFQFLPDGAMRNGIPSIKIRDGRVNFKFGDTKSVVYFSQASLNVVPSRDGTVEIDFDGEPSRTDRQSQAFGRFYLNGTWDPREGQRLDMDVELKGSSLDELTRLIDPRGFGLDGTLTIQAHLGGSPGAVQVTGQTQIGDVHRWDLLPKGGAWTMPFQGKLDLRGDRLDLASVDQPAGSPVALEFHTSDLLTAPHWEATARLNEVPLTALLEVARNMGAALPENVSAEGGVSGSLNYTQQDGFGGEVQLHDASLTLPEGEPLRAASATVAITDGVAFLYNTTVEIGSKESAEVEAAYTLTAPRDLDLRVSARALNIADMHSLGVAAIPLLDQTKQGTWRGWARFQGGEWSGEYELQNVRIPVPGLADPVRIQSAAVKLNGKQVIVTGIRGSAGEIKFTGDYRWQPDAVRPHKFDLAIGEASVTELARLLEPSLVRERGFLARTLRLDPAPAPEWLKSRRADGNVTVGMLNAGDTKIHLDRARLLWDATLIRLSGVDARLDQASAQGDLEIDVSGLAPHFKFDGQVAGVPYKGGKLDFLGTLESQGSGPGLWESAHAVGELRGQSIAFSPDAEFRTAMACFEMQGSRWKFSDVEVTQGADSYLGTGSTQPDGRLLLDLARGGRQVRFSGPLYALAP